MTTATARPKWRITKSRGMWTVRRPDGAHFGAYFTWREAMAQSTARPNALRAGNGGYFDRAQSWDFDLRPLRFGFQDAPARCATQDGVS